MSQECQGNIAYATDELARYYCSHRCRWADLYPSERAVFERIAAGPSGLGSVLDVGCAAGGLGLALAERFGLAAYTGVEINPQCAAAAPGLIAACPGPRPGSARIVAGDILDCPEVPDRSFDTVVSLSCADWNLETSSIIAACWRRVRPGGSFVLTLRLTPGQSARRMAESFQYIDFGTAGAAPEQAPYVVLNAREALAELAGLTPRPETILAHGYWGVPSPTARTPHDRLVFACLALSRPLAGDREPVLEATLPASLFH